MNKTEHVKKIILYSLILIGVIAYSAICYHSIEEIHYLKSFFPRQFTVEEAYYATVIELIKIIIIGIPFFLVIGICLVMLKKGEKDNLNGK